MENSANIDIVDAALLDFMVSFSASPKIDKIIESNTVFFWFSHDAIISQLPMLKLKKDSVYKRLIKLCEKGFLIKFPASQKLNRSYYAISEKSFALSFEPSENNPKGFGNKSEGPSENNPNDNNISNNLNKINTTTYYEPEKAKIYLKNNQQVQMDRLMIQHKLSKDQLDSKIDEFVNYAESVNKNKWINNSDLARHFESWLSKRPIVINNYKNWTEKEFCEEVEKVGGKNRKEYLRKFIDVFKQTGENGKMRFQNRTAWDTATELKLFIQKELNSVHIDFPARQKDKVSARTILAQRLAENTKRNKENGNTTIDIEIVE